MRAEELLSLLRDRNVRLEAAGGDLRVAAPRGTLTPELWQAVRERKEELLRILRTEVNGAGGPEWPEEGPAPQTPAGEGIPAGGDDPAPLSFAQERMWFLDQIEPGSAAYHRPFAFRLRGPLDRDALERSLREILKRHESLRTRFPVVDGEPVQEVVPDAEPALRTVDLSGVPADDRAARLRSVLDEEGRRPFDLARGPLIRFLLARLGPDDHAFMHDTHHTVSDGWSTGIFHRELEAFYGTRVGGSPTSLPHPTVRYADYARWQRSRLRGDELDEHLRFWVARLGEEPPVLELPLDRPRPPVQTYRGAGIRADLERSFVERVRTLAREARATPFMALLSVWALLLHRYSGQDDVAVGVPVAGRERTGLEDVIGLFVNTVVLRVDLSGDPTFRELLARVREAAVEAFAHQEVPVEKVVQAIRPERSASHHPLFQVLFTHWNAEGAALSLPGLEVTPLEVERGATYMDLDFSVGERDDGSAALGLRYNTDLFEAGTARRMVGHYRRLLEAAVEGPDRPVSALPILTEPEERIVLWEWNETGADLGPARPIHELVRERARSAPDRVALVVGDRTLTYRDLTSRAAALARRLRRLGVGPGATVGVATDRNPALVTSVLGVLEAGGAYLPLDPSLPRERLEFMLEDAGATVVVADGAGLAALPDPGGVDVVELSPSGESADAPDAAPGEAGPEHHGNVPPDDAAGPGPDDLAYVIYTSGSTGRPKGVEVPHRAVYNFLRSVERSPGLGPDDVVLAVTTLSFDISVLELFLPLWVGARVVLADTDTAADGRALLEAIRNRGVTLLQATPATWRLLLEAGWEGDDGLRVLSGGEDLPPDLARQLAARSREVWNLYGPTETTVWSARYRLPEGGTPIRIGRPIENTRFYVLDRAGRTVPVGVAGELHIAGAGVARGYRNRDALTADRFVADPFSDDPGAGMYRTGDRCRFRPDGTLEFLGRSDRQVKVRGFRVELGEIETVLSGVDEIQEAAAAVWEDGADDRRLVAYVAFRPGRQATSSEIRRRLRSALPDYMVPSLIVEVGALPRTPSGKVDRRALPDPLGGRPGGRGGREEPATEVERLVAEIWADLLGVDEIGRRDNFFDLGGHSLLSMRAVQRIEERTGARVNPRVLILNTLEQVAAETQRAAEEAV